MPEETYTRIVDRKYKVELERPSSTKGVTGVRVVVHDDNKSLAIMDAEDLFDTLCNRYPVTTGQ